MQTLTEKNTQEEMHKEAHNKRFYGLDFCRAVFMCLGLVFHCGLIYGSGQDWRVTSDETLSIIKYLSNFIHHFRMEAFYLVSGFFYFLVFIKGRSYFLKDRINRALIPMMFVGLTLNFIMNGLSYNKDFQWGWQYFVTGQWLGHLWFLGNLLVYFALSVGLCSNLRSRKQSITQHQFLICAVVLLFTAQLGHWFAVKYALTTIVFINFGYLFYYYPFFLLGILSYAAPIHFFNLIKLRYCPWYLLSYAGLQTLALIDISVDGNIIDTAKMLSHFPLMLAAFSILNYIGDRGYRLVRTFSDASYTIYLLHQPLIIVFYVYIFKHTQLSAMLEYALLITLVLLMSLLFHLVVVKNSALMRLLFNGVTQRNNNNPMQQPLSHLRIN